MCAPPASELPAVSGTLTAKQELEGSLLGVLVSSTALTISFTCGYRAEESGISFPLRWPRLWRILPTIGKKEVARHARAAWDRATEGTTDLGKRQLLTEDEDILANIPKKYAAYNALSTLCGVESGL
jgi:hypothetical protein